MPPISLYLLNHNYGLFLEEAIQSVLDQTFTYFEFIIIDDGSVDKSRKILQNLSQTHPQIKIVYQENYGLIASANKAVEISSGYYLIRLDADDILHPDALKILCRYAENYPDTDWIIPGYYLTNQSGEVTDKKNRGMEPFYISLEDTEPHGACSLIKRKTLLEVGGYSSHVTCRDGLDLFLKIKEKRKILSVPEHLFYYRQHNQSLTRNKKLIEQTESVLLKRNL
ncbi:glycosyltransferase family 2 protein [Saccharicrinis sp. FJH54]|uniref:glycosyltransferase family 2 protein n=1 Tax=Saccharicrinis sp. FJH54 TaxID=3344665 RepID=UPI0035D4AB90